MIPLIPTALWRITFRYLECDSAGDAFTAPALIPMWSDIDVEAPNAVSAAIKLAMQVVGSVEFIDAQITEIAIAPSDDYSSDEEF